MNIFTKLLIRWFDKKSKQFVEERTELSSIVLKNVTGRVLVVDGTEIELVLWTSIGEIVIPYVSQTKHYEDDHNDNHPQVKHHKVGHDLEDWVYVFSPPVNFNCQIEAVPLGTFHYRLKDTKRKVTPIENFTGNKATKITNIRDDLNIPYKKGTVQ